MSQITQFPSQTTAPIVVSVAAPIAEVVSTAKLRTKKTILGNVMQMSAAGDVPRTMTEVAKASGLGRATVYRHFPDLGALAADIVRPKHDAMVATLRAAEGINDVLVALLKYRRMLSSERALLCSDAVCGTGAIDALKEDVADVLADFVDQGSDAGAFYGRVLVDALWPRGEDTPALSAGLDDVVVIARISGLITQIKAVIANDRAPTTVMS